MPTQASTAALELYLAGKSGWGGNSQNPLAASIDTHLASLRSSRDSCSAELSCMQAIMDQLEEVCGHRPQWFSQVALIPPADYKAQD